MPEVRPGRPSEFKTDDEWALDLQYRLWELDDALDDLPRFFAVADQPAKGSVPLDRSEPHMVCCVSVDDVRELFRRRGAFAPETNQNEARS